MMALLYFILGILAVPFKSKRRLEAENAALRGQLNVLRRKMPRQLLSLVRKQLTQRTTLRRARKLSPNSRSFMPLVSGTVNLAARPGGGERFQVRDAGDF